MSNRIALALFVTLLTAVSAPLYGQFSMFASAGQQDVTLGGITSSVRPYRVGMNYWFATEEKSGGFIAGGGMEYSQTSGGPVPLTNALANSLHAYNVPMDSVETEISEFTFSSIMGFRVRNTAFGASVEWRNAFREVSAGDLSYSLGDLGTLAYGPYIRVGLGNAGTVPGRFALEGRYMILDPSGEVDGVFTRSGSAETITFDDSKEWRAGLSFAMSPNFILRADYINYAVRTSDEDGLLIAPGVLDMEQSGPRLSVAFTF